MNLTDITTNLANIATIGTLGLALYYARKINLKIEKQKNNILKEKEWQVIWADNFLKKGIKFNDLLSSSLVKFTLGHQLRENENGKKLKDKSLLDIFELSELEWDIKNYILFIGNNNRKKRLSEMQAELIKFLFDLHTKSGLVNLEEFRKKQFDYSKLIREIHSELLEIKPTQYNFDFYNINPN